MAAAVERSSSDRGRKFTDGVALEFEDVRLTVQTGVGRCGLVKGICHVCISCGWYWRRRLFGARPKKHHCQWYASCCDTLDGKFQSKKLYRCCGFVTRDDKRGKTILRGISGCILPGEMVALMGSSGAGKSTLLHVLSRHITSNTGSVTINSVNADDSPYLASSSFIQQEDMFYGYLTVVEHLRFQAALRLALPKDQREARLQDVIEMFSLRKTEKSQIGNLFMGAKRGISGGEKKRLAVATEILTNPKLIFADEPTSGLDGFMAEMVVKKMRNLADNGHTIICTIHQPSADLFNMFDKLLLLSDGHLIFFGPRPAVVSYFMSLGFVCPPYTNVADWVVELFALDEENPEEHYSRVHQCAKEWHEKGNVFLEKWDKTLRHLVKEEKPVEVPEGDVDSQVNVNSNFSVPLTSKGYPKRPKWTRIAMTLLTRSIVNTARNPTIVRVRIIQTVVTALFSGIVFFRLSWDEWYSKAGAVFFHLTTQGFMAVFTSILAFVGEKPVIIREKQDQLLTAGTFYVSKGICDFLFTFYLPLIFISITWWMMSLRDDVKSFFKAMVALFLTTRATAALGYVIASISQNMGAALAFTPIVLLPCLIVSGFSVNFSTLPDFWVWLKAISPFRYGFSALMHIIFDDLTLSNSTTCSDDNIMDPCTGLAVLRQFAIDQDELWFMLVDLVLLMVIFRLLGGLILTWKLRRKFN